jgi:hypothetical protein
MKFKAIVLTALLASGAAFASTAGDIAQCKMKSEQTYPFPYKSDKWKEREDNLRLQGSFIQTCMEASGYHFKGVCVKSSTNQQYVTDRRTCISNNRSSLDAIADQKWAGYYAKKHEKEITEQRNRCAEMPAKDIKDINEAGFCWSMVEKLETRYRFYDALDYINKLMTD